MGRGLIVVVLACTTLTGITKHNSGVAAIIPTSPNNIGGIMYFISVFIAAFLFVSCGDDGGTDGAGETAPAGEASPAAATEKEPYDVIRLSLEVNCYQALDECVSNIDAVMTGGGGIGSVNRLVLAISETAAPEKCDDKSISGNEFAAYVSGIKWKLGTKYFIRGCVFDGPTATYSPGITADYTTEPAE